MYLYFILRQTDLRDVGLAFRSKDPVFIAFHMKLRNILHSTMLSSVVYVLFFFSPSLNQVEFKAAYLNVFMRLKWK